MEAMMNAAVQGAVTQTNGGGSTAAIGSNNNCGDDLLTLDAEITELHRENARVESQMMRLKSDINAMETHITHVDRVRNNAYVLVMRTVSKY